jgi:ABC-type branched-subunit amino acid transport system ATPase component
VTAGEGGLEAVGITRTFGGVTAVDSVDIAIRPGRVTLVLGPNGAGKSTLVNCITGVDRPDSGRVLVDGRDVTGWRPNRYARLGVVRTFQHARPFAGLTIAENVMVGAHGRTSAGALRGTLRTPGARKEEAALRAQAGELLAEVGLGGRGGDRPSDLPLADERRLEIARCLAAQPRVLLLDEPAAGLGEAEADALAALVRRLCSEQDLGVLLIEHHLELALGMADDVVVLDFGRVIARGTPAEIRQDPAVQSAYIGVQEQA